MMNPFDLVKIGAGALIAAGAYFFGLHNGQNSEQLKIARTQISDRLRSRIASLEKRAKSVADRDTVRCLQLGAECRRLLQEVRGPIEYCRKALQ